MRPRTFACSLFLLACFVAGPLLAQEAVLSTPLHYRGFDPAQPLLTVQGSGNQTGNITEFRDRTTGAAVTWMDFNGRLNALQANLSALWLNKTCYADQMTGTTAGAKIAACFAAIEANPLATGGTTDARGLEGTQAITQDIFAGVTKPGTLLLGSANFATSVTQNIPTQWTIRGQWAARVDGVPTSKGTVFTWTGAINSTVLNYFNTEFTSTTGITVNCNTVAGCRGILVDSNNAPAAHTNQFENIYIYGPDVGMQVGTSGGVGRQSDGFILRNFEIENPTTAGLRFNSQNCCQNSIIERGYIRIPANNSAAIGIDVSGLFWAPSLRISNVAFGVSQIGYTGASIDISTDVTSSGSPLTIADCSFEIPSSDIAASPAGLVRTTGVVTATTVAAHNFQNGATVVISGSTSVGGTSFDGAFVITSITPPSTFTYAQALADDTGGGGVAGTSFALRATTNDGSAGVITLLNNSFAISMIYVSGIRRIISIGNVFTAQNSPYFSPASINARVTSIGDTFSYGRWVVPAVNTPLVELNRVPTGGTFQAPIHVTAIPNGYAGILAESSKENPIGLRLQNTSAAPSNWEFTFPGTGGAYPGDFVLYDRINTRVVLYGAKATGVIQTPLGLNVGTGTTITKHLSATAALDFPNTAITTCSDLTIAVAGAADGNTVAIGVPIASIVAGGSFTGFVSAANVVTVRFCADVAARDPANGTFRADVWQH